MVKAKKLGLVGRCLLAIGAAFSLGGCLDEYAAGGAALKGVAQVSKSPRAGVAAYALGEAVQTTGNYRAAERTGAASAPNIYIINSPQGNNYSEQNETIWDKAQKIQQPKKKTLWDLAQEAKKPTVPNLWDELNKK